MSAGKMLMVSKVQDGYIIFYIDREKGLRNWGRSQDYLVSCPTVNFQYIYLDFKIKSW